VLSYCNEAFAAAFKPGTLTLTHHPLLLHCVYNCGQGMSCGRGVDCPFAHSVYEYWLHPTRFRTQMCKKGNQCNRTLCFFAHR
jgi:hypothetical protein